MYSVALDAYALVDEKGSGEIVRYVFDHETLNLGAYQELQNGKLRYSIDYADYTGGTNNRPQTMRIRNRDLGYRIEIRVIDYQAMGALAHQTISGADHD